MVTISSFYFPKDVVAISRDNLKQICSALVTLSQVVHVERGGVILKPLITIEYTTPTCIARVTFVQGVKVDDIVSAVPLDAEYSPLNISQNGREQQKSVD